MLEKYIFFLGKIAKETGINYSSAKVILKIFRKEGRTVKKTKKIHKKQVHIFFCLFSNVYSLLYK